MTSTPQVVSRLKCLKWETFNLLPDIDGGTLPAYCLSMSAAVAGLRSGMQQRGGGTSREDNGPSHSLQ